MRTLLSIFLILATTTCAWSDVRVTQDNEKYFGLSVSRDKEADTVVFLVLDPDSGKFIEQKFRNSQISNLTTTVQQEALANLDFNDLQSVLNAAEN